MKVAITTNGKDRTGQVDPRFGRAQGFAILDTETGTLMFYDNQQNLQATQGAGIQTAQNLAALEVDAVITGNVGPKAYRTLRAAGIEIYLCRDHRIEDALADFHAGTLQPVTGANVEGHW